MGNQVGILKKRDKEAVEFINFLQNRKRVDNVPTQKITWNYQQKWKISLLEILDSLSKKDKWKSLGNEIKEITKQIKIENFIKSVSVVSAMDNQDVFELNSKSFIKDNNNNKKEDIRLSRHVFLDMKKQFNLKEKFNQSTEAQLPNNQSSKTKNEINETFDKQTKQLINLIVAIQFNRPYHPFSIIKSSFMMIFTMKYRHKLNEIKLTQKSKQKIYTQMYRDLDFLSQFFAQGSLIYKKWILKYGNIKEQKFIPFMKKVSLNSIFYGSNNLYQILLSFIKQMNQSYFKVILPKIKENVSIKKFDICEQLQIEGNFVNSLQMFSKFDRINSPKKLLTYLERVKNQICNDIDLYHRYFQTNKNYTIDGDNLLGILCFQICRMKHKITDIYSQLVMLSVVYGQSANISFGVASYMVTALTATFEYLQSEQFNIQTK